MSDVAEGEVELDEGPIRMLKEIPPDSGFSGLPIADGTPKTSVAWAFMNEEMRPRREWIPPDV